MKKKSLVIGLSAFAILAAGGAFAISQVVRSNDENEPVFTLDEVPAAVRATILAHVAEADIVVIELDTESGSPVYDVEKTDGSEIMVAADGAYLGVEADDDDDAEGDDD
ncbi:MAG: hypothetical protein H7Y88_09785 [Phycisphaerales bacterium]|nr:hypothetical protein [Phycisphaerales bacterium]